MGGELEPGDEPPTVYSFRIPVPRRHRPSVSLGGITRTPDPTDPVRPEP